MCSCLMEYTGIAAAHCKGISSVSIIKLTAMTRSLKPLLCFQRSHNLSYICQVLIVTVCQSIWVCIDCV